MLKNWQKNYQKLSEKVAGKSPFGHKAKFALGDLGVILLDGSGTEYQVSNEDGEADVTTPAADPNKNRKSLKRSKNTKNQHQKSKTL